MKQILNINLGGHPVTIDTDAYDHLSHYLDAIEKHFRESDASEEILSDIETRMAELFKENIYPRTIVTKSDVKAAIDIMGTPEMFGAESIQDDAGAEPKNKQSTKTKSGFNPGKRLFRDPESKILGGVSAGLSAYLGIADPIWLRIAFVGLTLAGFASIPIYIILWIVMPEAKSASDRLAMRGEPINVESIASSVVEELESLSDKLNDQFGKKKKSGGESKHAKGILTGLGVVLSTIILGLGKGGGLLLKIIGGIVIAALFIGWISLVISLGATISKASFFLPASTLSFKLGVTGLFFLLGTPLIGLILSILRIFFKSNHSRVWRFGLFGIWSLGAFFVAISANKIGQSYHESGSYKQSIPVVTQKETPVLLSVAKSVLANNDARQFIVKSGKINFDWNEIRLNIEPAPDNQFVLVQTQTALGVSEEDAIEGAKKFEYLPKISGTELIFPTDYFLPKGERFRVQKVEMTLYVPVGQKLVLDNQLRRKLDLDLSYAAGRFSDFFEEEVVMTKDGLRTLRAINALPQEADTSSSGTLVLPLEDFDGIDLSGSVLLNIQQGDQFRVKLRGVENGDPVQVKVDNGNLVVIVDDQLKKEIGLYVTMPEMERLTAKGNSEIIIAKFSGDDLELDLMGNNSLDLELDYNELVANVVGKTSIELKGTVTELTAKLDKLANINGTLCEIDEATVDATGQAVAKLIVKGQSVIFGKK